MYRSKILYNLGDYIVFTKYIIDREPDLTGSDFVSPLHGDYPLIAIIEVCHEYGTVEEEFVSHKDFKVLLK